MSTFKQLTYMVMDELKISSDDSIFTEDHIIFLLSKYRAFILKQRYSDIKKSVPQSNYQTICLDLVKVPAISGEPCTGATYLKSTAQVPNTLNIGNPNVYPMDFYQGTITYISRERMKYVGYNKYLQNIIYCSLGPDNYLYFNSPNPQFKYLEKVRFTGIFEDIEQASNLECTTNGEEICDIMDREFPIEDALIPVIIEMVVKELKPAEYSPKDIENNAADDLADLMSFIRRNSKSNLQKQIEG